MKKVRSLRLSYLVAAFMLFLASCSDSNKIDFTATDSANVEGEGTSDSYSSDVLDVSTDVVGGMTTTQLGGRENTEEPVQGFGDNDKLKCATITVSRTGTKDNPAGVITIAYPADGSCKDGRGVVRKGKIIITYTGLRFAVGSKIVTTFADFSIGGVKIEGTHTLTNVAATNQSFPRFNVTIAGGKLTFLNGKTITREQNFTREWQRATTPASDKWVLLKDGVASGTNRDGKQYLMTITKDLVYSRACQISNKVFIAVSGEKQFVSGDKSMTINYGDGACDNKVTITINGKSTEVEIKGDGN
jgi:hypothetical protein